MRRYSLLLAVLVMVLLVLVGCNKEQPKEAIKPLLAPTIVSDKLDYAPGEMVILTGASWPASESVHIFVNDDSGQTWIHNSNPDPVANATGGFIYQLQLPSWFVANYAVTATGSSGIIARTTFTDLSIGTYDQCSNDDGDGYASGDTGCRWINGNLNVNNSKYFEGDATVQRLWMEDFAPGSTHTVRLKYGTTKAGKHAYDFLTTWNWSEDWITLADRCQTITGCTTASETTTDIPQDPNVPDSFEPSAPGDRQFVMRGGTLNSATTPSIVSGDYTGDSETVITISFTVPTTGPMCPTSGPKAGTCAVALWFGAHVSAQTDWGIGLGAGGIAGSPYHVALDAIDGVAVGQRDNQMQSGAIIPNGTITIVKDTDPNDAQDFNFNLANAVISQNFTLDDDGDATLPNSQTFSVSPGIWNASELNILSGWSVTNIVCVDPTNNTTVDLSGGTASINLASLKTITCTFTNSRNTGSLVLVKSLTGGPSGYTGPFTINYDCDDGTAHDGSVELNAGASSDPITGIPSGTQCTVSEPTLPTVPGYTFGTPTFVPSATVTISSSSTVEVTTNNTLTQDLGSLTILKTLSNPDGATVPASFTIDYDCGGTYAGSVSVAAGGSQIVSNIPTGSSCTVSEPALTPIVGYTWGTPVVTGSPATIGKNTTIEVSVANSISRDLGSLVLAKSLTGGPANYTGPFTLNYSCVDGPSGNVQVNAGASETISNIPTGAVCTVSETPPTAPTGYTFGTPIFDPADPVTIPTGNGSSITVTTNNSLTRDTGSLKLSKSLSGGPSGYTGPFTISYDCNDDPAHDGSVTIEAGLSETISGIPTGTQCVVSETPPAAPTGYTFGTPTFTPNVIVTIDTKDATVEVTTNNTLTRDLGSLVLAKSLTGGPANYTGPFTIDYSCVDGTSGSVTISSGASETISGIPTGTQCTVSETPPTAPTGYTFGTPTFDPSDTVEIPAGNASSVTVTTNNTLTRDQGYLKISKVFDPLTSGFNGIFEIAYDCGGNTGTVNVAADASETVGPFDTDTQCTVSEPTLPSAPTGWTFGIPSVSGSPATIVKGDQAAAVAVTVTNTITRDLGSLKILKTVSNPDGASVPASFSVDYDCGAGYTGNVSVDPGTPATINNIPTGNTCTVTEVSPTAIPGYTWGTITYSPASVAISKDATVEISVGNSITRDTGSLKLTKSLTGGPSGYTGPFTISYDCNDGTVHDDSVELNAGASQTISGIPTGTQCTVSETLPTTPTGYTFGTPTFTPNATVTIDTKDATVEVTTNNTLTRDTGSLKILKTLSNPDGASVPANFSVNYNCGTGYTGTVSVSTSTPVTVNGIPTGSTCTVTEVAPAAIAGYTWGAITYTPASVTIATKDGTFEISVGNSITRDRGTIIIKKITKPLNTGSFTFQTTGTGYSGFTLAGGTQNEQTLPTGNYTVTESSQLGWILTGIGGSTNTNTPYNCTISGSGGSTGVGNLNTMTASISLKKGDTVTCVFENTGQGVTRTQGFWSTHLTLAKAAWEGGTFGKHTFPGVAATSGIGDTLICGRDVDASNLTTASSNQLMGGFWSSISKTTTNATRSALDQARMQLLQQLLAAELNASAFGSVPSSGSFAAWETALCGTNINAIKSAQQQAASFNTGGDSGTFTPGTSADSKKARAVADKVFWNIIKP